MKNVSRIAMALSAIVLATTANTALACGVYGPPPMSQTLHAALSPDARVAAGAYHKLRMEGQRGLAQVEMQRRWLPRQARQLDWQIKHLTGLITTGDSKLTEIQRTKHALRLANLRLDRAELELRRAALDSISERLGRAIRISLVVT
jgi:hypothetical protein